MADNVAITAGSGTSIAADDVSSVYYQKVKLDVGGDGASLPVSATANAIPVKALDDVITIDATPDTNALSEGDVLFATQEVAGFSTAENTTSILQSVTIASVDAQVTGIDLIFFNAATALGTENSAPDADDTEVLTVIGRVQIGAGSFYTLSAANSIACVYGIGLPMKAGTGGSIWVAGIARGTPTYAGGHLQIKLGVLRN
jgi:hypothetical protein